VLENRLGDMSVEVERGAVALTQLETYREQLRQKTKENRDFQLHIQGLVSQLKNLPYLQAKLNEASDELQDCKLKVEKIPGLMAEVRPAVHQQFHDS
jgi:flagellar biosynthesis chaperone FliJ